MDIVEEVAMITGISRVLLGVADQDSAKHFWVDKLGFECLQDTTMGGERWIEVRPRGRSGPMLSLVAGNETAAPDAADPSLPTSDVFFECDDIIATHAELSARGVPFSHPPTRQPFGWWAVFESPDGVRHALRQRDDEPLHT